jgi:uncharacterized membrane protein
VNINHLTDSHISRIQELIGNGVGDIPRLEHIKDTLEKGKTLYASDQIYLDSILDQYFTVKEKPIKKESITQLEQEPEKPKIQPIDEITTLQKKVESLEYNIELIRTKKKMSYGKAFAGVILLTIGIILVSTGGAAGMSFLSTPPYSGNTSSNVVGGWILFWIGVIPTIFGVRLVAKA